MTGIQLHDMNCGLKAYRNEVVKNIEVYGEMHRYIPYLAKNAGFANIGEKVVHHNKRKYGKSKFGLNRFINGYLGFAELVVFAEVWKEADAFVWSPWNFDVPGRRSHHPLANYRQTYSPEQRSQIQSCHGPAAVLSGAGNRYRWYPIVPCRLHCRACQPQFLRPQQLPY